MPAAEKLGVGADDIAVAVHSVQFCADETATVSAKVCGKHGASNSPVFILRDLGSDIRQVIDGFKQWSICDGLSYGIDGRNCSSVEEGEVVTGLVKARAFAGSCNWYVLAPSGRWIREVLVDLQVAGVVQDDPDWRENGTRWQFTLLGQQSISPSKHLHQPTLVASLQSQLPIEDQNVFSLLQLMGYQGWVMAIYDKDNKPPAYNKHSDKIWYVHGIALKGKREYILALLTAEEIRTRWGWYH